MTSALKGIHSLLQIYLEGMGMVSAEKLNYLIWFFEEIAQVSELNYL